MLFALALTLLLYLQTFEPMKNLTIFLIAIFCCFSVSGQTYEIGIFAGGANFIGDVGRTNFIAPNTSVVGGIFKWNRSPRHAIRASILFADLEASDLDSGESRRVQRGYEFDNSIVEGSLGIEYSFWEFNMFNGWDRPSTPYLYTGLTYFYHESFALDAFNDELVKTGSKWDLAIPMVMGFKTALSPHWIVAIEAGARYTFTDDLDGSYPGVEELGFASFGNINNKDWYMFTGVTLTYTFGRQPCYCGF